MFPQHTQDSGLPRVGVGWGLQTRDAEPGDADCILGRDLNSWIPQNLKLTHPSSTSI